MSGAMRREVQGLLELPLLGAGRRAAEALVEALGQQELSPAERRAVLAVDGRLRAARGEEEAVNLLAQAGQLAAEAGARVEELRYRLWTAGALAACGRAGAGRELLGEAVERARSIPALGPDWRLAEARCGHPDARRLLLDAVGQLPSPSRDADRVEAWRVAGERSADGGDPLGAARCFQQALELARRHDDAEQRCGLAVLLAHLHLQGGQVALAAPLLAEAVELAAALGDDLVLAAEGSILAAIRLEAGDLDGAVHVATASADAAMRRGNWIGHVDGAITAASCLDAAGARVEALLHLLSAAGRARNAGAEAAVNLARGRLGELRAAWGAEAFDAPFAEAVDRLGAR